jgi:hypothetical protein
MLFAPQRYLILATPPNLVKQPLVHRRDRIGRHIVNRFVHRVLRCSVRYLPAIELLMMHSFGSRSPDSEVARRIFARVLLRAAFVVVAWLTLALRVSAQPGQASSVQGGQSPPSSPDVVQGTVVNRVTREPVARALVYTPDNRFATLTDDRGHFELKFPPRDNTPPPNPTPTDDPEEAQAKQREIQQWYQRNSRPDNFFARKPGFLPPENSWSMSYSTAQHVSPIVIALEPEAHIIGHVQLPDMDGVEHGQIQLYRQEFEEGQPSWRLADTAKIRADGGFRFADLPAGTYKLLTLEQMERIPRVFNQRSQLFGYPPVYFPNTKDFSSATPIHLAAGTTFETNISLARREYYPVKIAVSGVATGSGVSIVLYPQGHPGPGYELGFDPSEEAIRGLLPDGSYTLKLSTQQQQQGSSGTLNFTVRGGPVEGLSIALIPYISLGVSVKTDFQVEVSSNEQAQRHGGRTIYKGQVLISLSPVDSFENGRGAFANLHPGNEENEEAIANVAPGTYWVRIQAPACYVASATWGGTDLLRHPLVVGSDGAGTPIEIVLRDDGAAVSGTVQDTRHDPPSSDESMAPPSNAIVYFLPISDSEGQFRSARVMEAGRLSLGFIPPGTYRLLAFASPQKELDLFNPVEMRKYESKGIVLQLAPNEREKLPTPLIVVDEP